MARIWREFKTPDGRVYYYNINSKQSTWTKPAGFDDNGGFDDKRRKVELIPKVAIPLENDWFMVICNTGTRFFYNRKTNLSNWHIDDPESCNLLAQLDKDKLVLLLGVIRGFFCPERNIYEEILEDIQKLKSVGALETAESETIKSSRSEDIKPDASDYGKSTTNNDGLVAGYESSDSDDGEVPNSSTVDETENPSITNLSDIEELNDVANTVEKDATDAFQSLFEDYDLDPYSTWSLQSKKVNGDPKYYTVADDSLRKELYENWCGKTISSAHANNSEGLILCGSTASAHDTSDDVEDNRDELEPTKYHYLSHIISKANILPNTIFKDIKNDNSQLFKQFKIKQSLKKKEQEQFTSRLLFYYKKMTADERLQTFEEFLNSKKTIIRRNIQDIKELRIILSKDSLPESSYEIETLLLNMENCIDIHKKSIFLQNETQYYTIGIKEKAASLHRFLKQFI